MSYNKSIINFDKRYTITIDGLLFHKTCDMCPEQYDVYKGAKQVGYVRLRWGNLTVDFPDALDKLIYHKKFKEEYKGCFNDDNERMTYLKKIAKCIKEELKNVNKRTHNK